MKYLTGEEVKVGDKVKLWEGCYGVVVCSFDANEYSKGFPAEDWDYLTSGIMIDSDKGGLIHFLQPNEDLELMSRK